MVCYGFTWPFQCTVATLSFVIHSLLLDKGKALCMLVNSNVLLTKQKPLATYACAYKHKKQIYSNVITVCNSSVDEGASQQLRAVTFTKL